ncbi:MAG: ribose-5-phosphate isomerase [Pseudonocardia sp.]|nr:ribose-5-phosphate isomerase [Pseudonocardia sp.]
MRVYLGSDHAGFELKARLIEHLTTLGLEPIDIGPATFDPGDDYPPYCIETALQVVADQESLGVVIGGSGNGEQMAANKVPGCRAALAYNDETARLAREHNDAQVVAVGARMHILEESLSIVETFLTTGFSDDPRHRRRIGMLTAYESTGESPELPA